MRKILCFVDALIIMLSFCACNNFDESLRSESNSPQALVAETLSDQTDASEDKFISFSDGNDKSTWTNEKSEETKETNGISNTVGRGVYSQDIPVSEQNNLRAHSVEATETDPPESSIPKVVITSDKKTDKVSESNGGQTTTSKTDKKNESATQPGSEQKTEPTQVYTEPKTEPETQSRTEPQTEPVTDPFDINYWISFAKSYAVSIGLNLNSDAIYCWDNPIVAGSHCIYLERNIKGMLDKYNRDTDITEVWIWAESRGDGSYDLIIGYG